MHDLAKRTGLSLATISKCINGGNVLESNRVAIEEAIRTLDYSVNEMARGLKSQKSMTVGFLTPGLEDPFCMRIVSNVERVLTSHGYGTVICDCHLDAAREVENARFLVGKKVDGVIAIPVCDEPAAYEYLASKQTPVVLIDSPVRGLLCNLVEVNNRISAFQLVSRLLELGHRRIGVVSLPKNAHTGIERLKGYTEALNSFGLAVNPNHIVYGADSMDAGFQAARTLLDADPTITCIVVFHDAMTFGALKALHERGLRYPDDVSIVGFDLYDVAEAFHPVLSDVIQPVRRMGRTAAQLLIGQLNKTAFPRVRTVTFKMELRLRGSVRSLLEEMGKLGFVSGD
jgi:LacI family transcriptional regulator